MKELPNQLQNAGFELATCIEQLAKEKASDGDIYSVHHLVSSAMTVHRMVANIERRYGRN